MTKMFIYEIQAFAYSDFQHHILLHEKKFSKIEFRKMIEIARQKAKAKMEQDDFYWRYNYPDNFIKFLKRNVVCFSLIFILQPGFQSVKG